MTESAIRRPLIAGNWKMHKTAAQAEDYITQLKAQISSNTKVDVAIAPPFPALEAAVRAAADSSITIAAQNVFWEEEGAYTGEVSAPMLNTLGVQMVIIGHSERRQYFGETDQTVNRRIKAAFSSGLIPIVCIGEDLDQREAGRTFPVLERQVKDGLAGIEPRSAEKLILAYEPIWAIGTGRTATPEMAQEAHQFIRNQLTGLFDKKLANTIRILYGGSVKPENTADLLAQMDVDGALVGGASLKVDVFYQIVDIGGR